MIMLIIVIFACGLHVLSLLFSTAPANEYGIAETDEPTGILGSVAAGTLASIALVASSVLA